ncbi:MAG: hypothetical protein E7329_02990 [Clostridiales bacterium]|nr:hypothetical protein [Clostridiales bacterium]
MSKQMNKMKKLSSAELITRLRSSKTLECSPIAYVVDLLDAYFQGKFTAQKLCAEYHFETKKAQFVFFHMSKRDIEDNKRVFKKEFTFGDGLTAVLEQQVDSLDAPAFDKALRECVEAYLASS